MDMEKNDLRTPGDARVRRSLDYLRKRSQHRVWWNSARIALRRGQTGEAIHPSNAQISFGKRV
jgi:hypothetical protein